VDGVRWDNISSLRFTRHKWFLRSKSSTIEKRGMIWCRRPYLCRVVVSVVEVSS
jgi:hypothetical protein